MDDYDKRILELLQKNGRMTMAELGRTIDLSTTATKERVRKLQEEGIITGFTAKVSSRALGLGLTAFITVPVGNIAIAEMGQKLASFSEIVECHKVTGDTCYIVKAVVRDTDHLERLVDAINDFARTTNTYIALSTLKSGGELWTI